VVIYSALQTMIWLKNLGGVAAMEKMNIEKSNLLYEEIERNKFFRCTVPNPADRSRMNVTFVMKDEYQDLSGAFLALAAERGLVGSKAIAMWAVSGFAV
jgi:phosphoserine aminotransferase